MGIQKSNSSTIINIINMKSLIAYSALLAVAFAAGPPAPYHAPAPVYGKGPVYEDGPAVYNYEYAVQDDYSGVNFGQNEHRDGYSTSGQYRVLLPDRRTQIVTYNTADAYSGNVAEVVYEGTASYAPAPVHKPVHPVHPVHPAPVHAPVYKPASVYHPAPVYKQAPVYKPAPYHG